MQAIKLQRKYPEVSQDEMFDLINRFKCVHHAKFYSGGSFRSWNSQIDTDGIGRVDKTSVLHALKSSGESYDRARETLKHVSVDASGKVELEDWVEVGTIYDVT